MSKSGKTRNNDLTIALLSHNAETTIEAALKSADFVEHILVIDNHSTDKTIDIALKFTDRIITTNEQSFAEKRNLALETLKTDWIFYLDTDEEITPELQKELIETVSSDQVGVYSVRRENYFLGRRMDPDWVERLFHRQMISGWFGKVHESPDIKGEVVQLEFPLFHTSHTDITSMLKKTNSWSEIEADLLMESKHPPIAWWRLIRVAVSTFWTQITRRRLWKYGREGWFEAYFQAINSLVVYTKLWEKQNQPHEMKA